MTNQASDDTPRGTEAAQLVEAAVAALARVRDERPRVHVLTNPVAMTLSANLLLAAGAVPSMTPDPAAQADFIGTSRALVVNLGMLDGPRVAALRRAVPEARRLGRPWLLDPVKVERSPDRLALARELADAGPAAVRGNAAELAALAGGSDEPALAALARRHRLVAAATGPVDFVADAAGRTARIANGSPLMDRVTAMGCAASALAGAFLAVEEDAFLATVAALLTVGVAGDLAAEAARGPGSFVPAFLDAVHALDAGTLAARARLAP